MFKDPYNESHWEYGEGWQQTRRGKIARSFSELQKFSFEGWAAAGVAVAAGSAIAGGVEKATSGSDLQSAAAKRPKPVAAQFETPTDSINDYVNLYNTESPYLQSVADQQNSTANTKYQESLGVLNPSLTSSIGTQGANANALLNGQIPADVQAQVQRSSAYQALTGQGSTDSGSAHALTARDLGTTSLNLQQQGSNMLAQSLANTKALSPYQTQATDLLYTPQQLLARSDSNAAYQAGIANQQANVAYQNSLNAAAANSYNPLVSGLTSGAGVLGTALNGSFGQQLGNSSYTNTATGGGTLGPANPYSGTYGEQIASSGTYNPYLSEANYDADGNFVGDASSFGG